MYDLEMILRFNCFGESHFLDASRLSVLFPCRQVVPGRRRKSRRDEDGFVRFNPSAVGCRVEYGRYNLFGHVPVGAFVRTMLCRLMRILTHDVLSCSVDEVSLVLLISCILVVW